VRHWRVTNAADIDEAGTPLPLDRLMDVPVNGNLVDLAIDYQDRLVVTTSAADPASPHSVSRVAYNLDVAMLSADGDVEQMSVADVQIARPFVQPTSDGTLLLVGSRSRYTSGGPESNALLVSPDGETIRSFCVGDGVQSVHVTRSGRVWMGYFDEGIFGNYGWGGNGLKRPLGSAGLVCWSLDGDNLYNFQPPDGARHISDCYAMTTVGDEAWSCYYTDFPIVQVDASFNTRGWPCGVRGAHAIAVVPGAAPMVGLVGGYTGFHDRLVVVQPTSGAQQRYRLTMPDGTHLPPTAQLVARGSFVHTLIDGEWLRLDLRDQPRPN